MRWVFFTLLVLNVVYLLWHLVVGVIVVPVPNRVDHGNSLAPEQLVLLLELVSTPVSGGVEGAPAPSLCPAVGPWGGLDEADAQLSALARGGYRGELRPVRVMKDRLFWVFLPPYEERDQALRVLRELQAREVDSFVVSEGPDQYAISLGYFSSDQSARGLSVQIRNEGYPAEVRETAREVTEYWLVFSPANIPDDGEALRQLLAESSGLTGEQVPCRRVVSPPAAPRPEETVEEVPVAD